MQFINSFTYVQVLNKYNNYIMKYFIRVLQYSTYKMHKIIYNQQFEFLQKEEILSSANANNNNFARFHKQIQQQGNPQVFINSNFNGNMNNNLETKRSSLQLNGTNLSIKIMNNSQQERQHKGFNKNNRKIIINSFGGSYGGINSSSISTTINTQINNQIGPMSDMNNQINTQYQSGKNFLNNNILLQYQSNKNSQILRIAELIEYLLGKGYIRDACDSFLDYIYQVQDLPFNQLLCDEFCEGSEELQLKESALLYKLSTKFSAYLMQPGSQSSSNNLINSSSEREKQIAQRDLDNSYIILQFMQKVLQAAQNKHDQCLIKRWQANYYSNLAIYNIRKHEYMLAINYFNLSLNMFEVLQAIIQERIQSQQQQSTNTPQNNLFNKMEDNDNDSEYLEEDIQVEDQTKNVASSPQQNQSLQKSNIQNQENNFTPIVDSSLWAIQESIVLNNLAVLHGIMGDLDKAEELLIQSVAQSENQIFKIIKCVSTQYLRKDKQFLEKLPVLIYGYIFCEGVKKKKQILYQPSFLQESDNMQSKNTFLKNAYSLSKKFFGEDNPFTMKIDIFRKRFTLHNQHADILAEMFPFEIDMQKLKNTQLYLQQQKNQLNHLNEMFGPDNQYINSTPRSGLFLTNRRQSESQMIDDLFNQRTPSQSQQLINQGILRGRNKSMHQIGNGNSQKIQSNFIQPFTLSPLHSLSNQQQQGQQNKSLQQRNQNQFRIQKTTIINKNQSVKKINQPTNINIGENTTIDEGQKAIQQEILLLKQSLSTLEKKLKSIKNTDQQNKNENTKNQSIDINKQMINKETQNGINQIQQSNQNQLKDNNGNNVAELNQSMNQQYSIANNHYINSNRPQSKSYQNQSSINRDERSNSNGSIKPSQFKIESKEKQDKQLKQSLRNQNSNEQQLYDKESKNPYINQDQEQDNQKQQSNSHQNKRNSISNQTPPIQNNNQSQNENQQNSGIVKGSQTLNKQGSNQNPSQIEGARRKQSSFDRQEQNFKQELKQQQILQQQQFMKENKNILQIKKSGSDEKFESPKLTSIIQQQQNYQILKITETIVQNLQVDQKFILKKRINLKDSNDSYVVKCGVLYNQQEKGYKIQISSFIGQNQTAAKVEEIELSILSNLLCFVSFQDVLPSTMNLDSINNLYDVCKYFILPFVGLSSKQPERQPSSGSNKNIPNPSISQQQELEGRVIMVNPRAHGILSEYQKTLFLEQDVLVQFNYIEGFQFRIVICDKETNKKNLRIDVEYDEGSFNGLYTTTEKDEYSAQKLVDFSEVTNDIEVSKQGIELVHRDIEIESLQNIYEKKQKTKTEEYFIQSVKIQSFSQFSTHFSNIIKEFERIIKNFSNFPNLESVCKDSSHFRVRVYQGLKKSVTIIVTDSENKNYPPLVSSTVQNNNGVRVLLFNNFESFGAQGTKVKEKGEQILTIKEIKKMYGLNYEILENEQKFILYSLCSYHFNLRIIEKKEESMQKAPSKVEENNILRIPTVSGGESTFLIAGLDNYNYPITLEIFGSKDIFLGIKITLYNPLICEEQGIFLTTNHCSWHFQNEMLKKKLHHFAVDSLPLSQYFITHIFKKIAVPVLFQHLYIENINPFNQKQASMTLSSTSIPFAAKESPDSKNYKANFPKLLGTKGLITDNCIIIRLETLLDLNSTINHFLSKQKR